MPAANLVPLPNSERAPVAGARRVGDADPAEKLLVSVVVRPRAADAAPPAVPPSENGGNDPVRRRRERRAQLAATTGADPADLRAIADFAAAHHLHVENSDAARRTVTLSGTVRAVGDAFGVDLGRYQAGDLTYRGREGHVHVPAELADRVVAVLGLDDRPQAHSRFKRGDALPEDQLPEPDRDAFALLGRAEARAHRASRAAKPVPLWATQVAQLYNFPTAVNGTHETIGIIELGGGFRPDELTKYFAKAGVPEPTVVAVAVDTGKNTPGGDADGEVLLDIEVAGTVAPGADIVVYFADPSDRGFLDAITTAVHDQTYAPSVISISWGAPESGWTAQGMQAFDQAFADASALGVTVLAAAGDHGAGDGAKDGMVHADFPASSPHVVGCGGTTLVGADGTIVSEVVWNDEDGWAGGGGISDAFPVPPYQTGMRLPTSLNPGGRVGRGVPDVAGNADITSGFIVLADGQWGPVGGTSAVAPLYAGLVALLNQALGAPVGELLPQLYAVPADERTDVFRNITSGDNATPETADFGPAAPGYKAGRGRWDACTGLGSLNGTGLLTALQNAGKTAAPA
jgi:kumamolisin